MRLRGARTPQRFGTAIASSDVVLSGSFFPAVPIKAGDSVVALTDRLGKLSLIIE